MKRTQGSGVVRVATRGALVALLSIAGMGACGDDTTVEKLKAVELGGGCTHDSQCEDKLVCIFERCHVKCFADKDCDPPLRCVKGEEGANVCQLEDDAECEDNDDCKGKQICAVDDECRDTCDDEGDCIGEQVCTPSRQCASSDPDRDTLGPDGDLIPKSAGDAGAGGASGSGGNGPSSGGNAPDASAGGSGSGGAEATGGTSSGGAEATGGSGPDSGGPDAGGGGFVEPGDEEKVDNNTHEKAVLAGSTASIYLPPGDVDWFKIQVPDGDGAYVLEIAAAHQPGAGSFLKAKGGLNREDIASIRTEGPAIGRLFLTLRAGSSVYIELTPDGPNTGGRRIDLSFSLTPENDSQEPNDDQSAAAEIQPNVDVRAQCLRAYVTPSDLSTDDWYRIELDAGPVTFVATAHPFGDRLTYYVNGPGLPTRHVFQVENVLPEPLQLNLAQGGTFYLHVYGTGNSSFWHWATNTKPRYMSEQYAFQVQQGAAP